MSVIMQRDSGSSCSRLNLTWVHSKHTGLCIWPSFPFQFCRHVSQHLIQGGFTRCICPKPIFVVPKESSGARIRRDENDLGRRCNGVDVQQLLRNDDWADRVGVQMKGEVAERTEIWSVSEPGLNGVVVGKIQWVCRMYISVALCCSDSSVLFVLSETWEGTIHSDIEVYQH